ncbi:hypothetical protein OEZ85_010712 [Tetradesmus obliquus]|uniref:FHA domain-containing protein n=1 Tax=Tetradesmus obliquus TaxID=3088 RepID=A0ABY8TN28_TETOB|nr:hypothetical protein OEZ85_010712 [Tetradesmus obliquus]
MATLVQDSKRPRDENTAAVDGQSDQKRAKAAEQEPAEQQQHQQQQQQLPVPVPAVADHIEASRLLPALQQLLSVYKVEYWALLEEMRAKRQAYCEAGRHSSAQSNAAAAAAAAAAAQEQAGSDAAAAAAAEGSLRQLLQSLLPVRGPAAGSGDVVFVAEHRQANQQQQQQERNTAGTSDEAAAAALQQQQYGDERCGYGSRDDPLALPSPAEVEAALLQLPPGADKGAASKQQLQAWHERFKGVAEAAAGLEQLASAATTQYMDAQGGLACLCGAGGRWVIRRSAVSLGRSSDSKGDVDVDLAKAPAPAAAAGAGSAAAAALGAAAAGGGGVRSVSRLQAQLSLGLDGVWSIRNTGRAPLAVNGRKVSRGSAAPLPHLSLLEVGGEPLLFMVNGLALRRAVARSSALVM